MTKDEKKDIIKFLKKMILFFPVYIYLLFPIIIMFFAGEFVSVDTIIQEQLDNHRVTLFGLAYSGPEQYYKYHAVLRRQPDIIALGTSRVMQFRSKFFNPDIHFYNAGGVVQNASSMNSFLQDIPLKSQPKVIILGIDQDKMTDLFEDKPYDFHAPLPEDAFNFKIVWSDYIHKKFLVRSLFDRPKDNVKRYGLTAIIKGNGFVNDGSYYYGNVVDNPLTKTSARLAEILDDIAHSRFHFEWDGRISIKSLHELYDFLDGCKRRGIHVIGFMPPYAPSVYGKMMSMNPHYAYISELDRPLHELFDKFGYNFFNFTDPVILNATDDEFIDGSHGSNKTYLKILIRMAQQDDDLRKICDVNDLKRELSAAKNQFLVFNRDVF